MIQYGDEWFDDMKLRPFGFTHRLLANRYNNECEVYVVYGMPEGIGKSGYVHHVLADVSGYEHESDKEKCQWLWEKRPEGTPIWDGDWNSIKDFILYLPEDVVKRCKDMLERGERSTALHWDDAGTWLNAMDYHDPFVIAFMKYLSLARSSWGGIILSTPIEDWVLKKLRSAMGVIHVKVVKSGGSGHLWRPRIATGYKAETYPGARKIYYPRQWEDQYVGIMPDPFYQWYKPQRDHYTIMAVDLMEKALEKRRKKGLYTLGDETVMGEIKEHIAKANDNAEDLGELIGTQGELKH